MNNYIYRQPSPRSRYRKKAKILEGSIISPLQQNSLPESVIIITTSIIIQSFYDNFKVIILQGNISQNRPFLNSLSQTTPCLGQYYRNLQGLQSKLMSFTFVHHRFANVLTHFGLSLHLQHLGNNIFMFQILFGIVTIPANCAALLALNQLGRRKTQMLFLFLLAVSTLAITWVSEGKKRPNSQERKCLLCPQFSQVCTGHTYFEQEENGDWVLTIPQNQSGVLVHV